MTSIYHSFHGELLYHDNNTNIKLFSTSQLWFNLYKSFKPSVSFKFFIVTIGYYPVMIIIKQPG